MSRDKGVCKRKNRRMVWGKGNSSDESDEDYMVGEDEDAYESEDDYGLNLDGDESEEVLGELEEEDEEFVEKKVKVGRVRVKKGARARGRKKNGFAKPRKKMGTSHIEEEEDDADYNLNDEEINKDAKPRKRRRVSYREEDDGMNSSFNDMNVNKVVKTRKKKRVSYREEDDDYDGSDRDFDVAVNAVVKSREKRRVSYKDEDEEFDVRLEDFDDMKVNGVAKGKKKDGVSYKEEDDDYDGIDDDDEDEEFSPDEIDGVDDEDELPAKTKKKRVGRPQLQGKRIKKGKKRKRNSKVLKKTVRKKPRKNSRMRRARAGGDREFRDSEPMSKDKNKKCNGRTRTRRLTIDSDSDFPSTRSSDYEFTISEEEREQIREANEFCRKFTTGLRTSANKLEDADTLVKRKHLTKKGKEKFEDPKVEAGKQICGICLTEEGKRTVRGTLSCCSHYFCFACIMEWSKVESRCPLCKQRFVTISKPAKSNTGFDLRTMVIQIPERDQVYQPSEEDLQDLLNPYNDVICTECHQGGDDALMLLCDLCDSPAHTYCVGLGHQVPEGNWYCDGCRPTALASSSPEGLTPTPDYRTNSNLSSGVSHVPSITETFDLNEIYVPETPMTEETSQLVPLRSSGGDVQLPSPGLASGAHTVLERRRIQHQIHQLFNNRRQMDDRASEVQATVSGNSLVGSEVGWSSQLERLPSNDLFYHESLQENIRPSLHSQDLLPARSTHAGGPPCQDQPSTSSNRSFSGFSQNGFSGLNTLSSLGMDQQQFRPCSSRSNIGSSASISLFNVGKEQVQSMVKSQLKSLSRDLELGYNTFKDIARASAHTILAACGVEHRGSEVHPVQASLTCTHIEKPGNRQNEPVKGHCSSCFDLFVRNVVAEIMTQVSQGCLTKVRNR